MRQDRGLQRLGRLLLCQFGGDQLAKPEWHYRLLRKELRQMLSLLATAPVLEGPCFTGFDAFEGKLARVAIIVSRLIPTGSAIR